MQYTTHKSSAVMTIINIIYMFDDFCSLSPFSTSNEHVRSPKSTSHMFVGFSALIKLHAFSLANSFFLRIAHSTQYCQCAYILTVNMNIEQQHGQYQIKSVVSLPFYEYLLARFPLFILHTARLIRIFSFACAKTVKWPFLIRHAADCTQITFLQTQKYTRAHSSLRLSTSVCVFSFDERT